MSKSKSESSFFDVKSLTTLTIGAVASYLFTGSRVGQERNADNLLSIPQIKQSILSLNNRDDNLRKDIVILQNRANASPTNAELKLRADIQSDRLKRLEEKVERLMSSH